MEVSDKVVMVGDMPPARDRGPKPKEVLFFLRELPAGPPRVNFDGIAILFFG